jgi:hypothetical protein
MAQWVYNTQSEVNLMKIVYDKYIDKQFNKSCPLLGLVKKDSRPFEGLQVEMAVQLSVGGGRTSGSLGTTNPSKTAKVILTTKKIYGRVEVDNESMKASRKSIEAFAKFTKEPIDRGTDGVNLNLERQMIANDLAGSGLLFTSTTDLVTGDGTTATPYVVTLEALAIDDAVEIGDYISAEGEATILEVVDIDDSGANTTLELVGTSAAVAAAVSTGAAIGFYMEKSEDNELSGLAGLLLATSGTYKNVDISRRWRASQTDAGTDPISVSLLNQNIMTIKKRSGKAPKSIHMPYEQYVNFLNLLESAKTYNVPTRDKAYKGQISFSAIEYMGPAGPIPVFLNRFIRADRVYVLNEDHIQLRSRGPLSWDDHNGMVFDRLQDSDAYEARCTFYCDFFANPHFQGIIYNLSTALVAS